MFWDFASAPASSAAIDALLDQPDVTVEQLLDEPDVIDETKGNHPQLVAFWAQPRVAVRLLEHAIGRAALPVPPEPSPEWHEKVFFRYPYLATEILTADVPALSAALLGHASTTLSPFFAAGLPFRPEHAASPLPHHSHPLFAQQVHPPTRPSSHPPLFPRPKQSASRPPPPPHDLGPGRNVLLSYWARVISHLLETHRAETTAFLQAQPFLVERLAANAETPAVIDLIHRIIEIDSDVTGEEASGSMVQWFSEHRLVPTLVALLSSVHSRAVHNNVASLLRSIIERSGPGSSPMQQEGMSAECESDNLLKPSTSSESTILVRDLASPEVADMLVLIMLDELPDEDATSTASEQPELPEEEELELPLNPLDMPSSEDQLSAYFNCTSAAAHPPAEGSYYQFGTRMRASKGLASLTEPDTAHPPRAPRVPKTPETTSSALVTAAETVIELIRKNNSDYFEQNLFQYLRQTIMIHQQVLAKRRTAQRAEATSSSLALGPYDARPASDAELTSISSVDSDDFAPEEVAEVDEAVRSACDKMGIVHLGPLLRAISRRLSDLQRIVLSPPGRAGVDEASPEAEGDHTEPASPPASSPDQTLVSTVGAIEPLTAGRQRVCELYAELLHCSNMALLNRPTGTGPEYDPVKGTLLGGIHGFQALTDALNSGHSELEDAAEEELSTAEEVASESVGAAAPLRHSTELVSPESPDVRATSLSTDGPSSPRAWEESTVGTTVPPGNEESETKAASYEDIAWDHRLALKARIKTLAVPVPEGLVDGDLLKERFLSLGVLNTLLDLFFLYPWNNLLHNVVFDIVQQCFNARLTVAPSEQATEEAPSSPQELRTGLSRELDDELSPEKGPIPQGQYSRALALELLGRADLCGLIVRGNGANEVSSSGPRKIRLGFMGHLNLIAEEAAKVLEKYPHSLGVPLKVQYGITRHSVEWEALVEQLRLAQDNADELGGPRPTAAYSDSSEYDTYHASQIIGSFDDYNETEDGSAWAAGVRRCQEGAWQSRQSNEEDVGWDPFSDPLAAPDWDAEFKQQTQEQDERNAARGRDHDSDESSSDSEESMSDGSSSDENEYDPFVDLLDPRSRANVFRQQLASPASSDPARSASPAGASPILIPRPDRNRRSSAASSSGSSLELVADPQSPLGPGVDPDSTVDDRGVLVRTFDMGLEPTRIQVPLDDVALALSEAQHMALS